MINGAKFHGIDIEILNKMSERLGLTLKFIKCPFARCLEHMKEGKADLMSSLLKRSDREAYIRYLEPHYYNDRKVFYVLKGKSHILRRYEDLYNIKVGVKRKVKYFPRFDEDMKINKAYFGISKRSKFISQAAGFEKVLAQMIEEGQVDTIKRHFMSQVVVREPIKKQ